MRLLVLPFALAASACATPQTYGPANEIEAFMWGYTRAWNAHDAGAIARDYYRMNERDVAAQTEWSENAFANLRAQGWNHSNIHRILGCVTGPDEGWAGMRFARLNVDGAPLPPPDRASAYALKKFSDGWRITALLPDDASKPLACPAD